MLQALPVPSVQPAARGRSLPADYLINYSHRLLIESLERHGNKVNQRHQWALKNILSTYTKMAYGLSSGIVAAALGTGLGKTQSIIAWSTALNDLGYDDVSLTVCSSQVEALCDIKRALVANGFPEDRVGLWHTYPYDPEKAQEYLSKKTPELKGYASLPSTEDHQSKQILLVTHNRVRGKGRAEAYSIFQGRPRELFIWDESFFISDSVAIEDWKLESAADGLRRAPGEHRRLLREYLLRCIDLVETEKAAQHAGHRPELLDMPTCDDDELQDLKGAILSGVWPEEVSAFLDISQLPLRVYLGQQGCVIRHSMVIDPQLKNIVVLDASHGIRTLCHENKSVYRLWQFKAKPVASYENVTIHQLRRSSGRTSVERYAAELGKTDSGVLKEAVEVIKRTPKDEAILIFVFKTHSKGQDHISTLKRSLAKNGIDPNEMITAMEEGKLVSKPRINFLTWGNECSLNRYSYCSTVILAGVLHQNKSTLAGRIIGERNDLTSRLSSDEVDTIHKGELCHLMYQALSRGSCRVIINGKARGMTAWLIHKDLDIRGSLNDAMPGVQWEEWVPVHQEHPRKHTKPGLLADKIINYLNSLPPEEQRVSTKQIKKALNLKDYSSSTVKRALEIVQEKISWRKDGKSLVRLFA